MTIRRAWALHRALTLAELRETRDFTIPGVLRWILEPLSYMVVYFIVVASILGRVRFAYPLFLLAALIPWRYFAGVTQESMLLIDRYAEIIKNRAFPKEILPLVLMTAEGSTLLVALLLFAPMMAVYNIGPSLAMFWIPVILVVLFVLTSGPTYMTTLLGLYFVDFRGATQNLIRAMFFVSTGLVPIEEVPGDELPLLLQANPFSGIFDSLRAVIIEQRNPDWPDLVYPFVVGLVLMAMGVGLYRWRRFELPKEV